ncbi:diphthamide biosynthesis protein, partial [Ramicandelaber brevisporus]
LIEMSAFSNNEREVIERPVDTAVTTAVVATEDASLRIVFEIERTARIIVDREHTSVGLQFPDELLGPSFAVVRLLRAEIERLRSDTSKSPAPRLFVMADTTHGSCCVDEIAAEHANASLVVQYGSSCLSTTSRIPVVRVFTHAPLDTAALAEAIVAGLSNDSDEKRPVLLTGDVRYDYALDNVADKLRSRGLNSVIVAHADNEITLASAPSSAPCSRPVVADTTSPRIAGRAYELPSGHDSLANIDIVFIGAESMALANVVMTSHCNRVFSAAPDADGNVGELCDESTRPNRLLMRRYYQILRARDADVVGVVAGTLGVASYRDVISSLERTIRAAGKKCYMISIGKPNPNKLANFSEIEAYVLVACPEATFRISSGSGGSDGFPGAIDPREFSVPVLTPYEMDIALSKRDAAWASGYAADFATILKNNDDTTSALLNGQSDAADDEESEETPSFSMVSGQLKQAKRYADVKQPQATAVDAKTGGESAESSTTVTVRNNVTDVAVLLGSAAAEYLHTKRTFIGLERDVGTDTVSKLEEGRSGVASGYTNPSDSQKH